MAARGIPGLMGTEHVGFTVPDLEEAVAFFNEVIGCDFIFDGGSADNNPDLMTRQLGVHRDATVRYCFMRCASGVNFEIFEYTAPDQVAAPPRNSDIGGHHFAFYVEDIDAALDHLRSHAVRIMGDVQVIEQGPAGGSRWIYFLAPWGLQLELVSYPDGKGYERTAERLLWHPGHPER